MLLPSPQDILLEKFAQRNPSCVAYDEKLNFYSSVAAEISTQSMSRQVEFALLHMEPLSRALQVHVCVCVHAYVCVRCGCEGVCEGVCACVFVCVCVCVRCEGVCMCMHVCVCMCMHGCVHVHVTCVHKSVRVCMCMCTLHVRVISQ